METRHDPGGCPDAEALAGLVAGTTDELRRALEEHLAACGSCCARVGHLAAAAQSAGGDPLSRGEEAAALRSMRRALRRRDVLLPPARAGRPVLRWSAAAAAAILGAFAVGYGPRSASALRPGPAAPHRSAVPERAGEIALSGRSAAEKAAARVFLEGSARRTVEPIELFMSVPESGADSLVQALDEGGSLSLAWSAAPSGAGSLVLFCEHLDGDPSEPRSSLRWALINLPPDLRRLDASVSAELSRKAASRDVDRIQIVRCHNGERAPRNGEPRRYRLTLYALDMPMLLPSLVDAEREWGRIRKELLDPHALAAGDFIVPERRGDE